MKAASVIAVKAPAGKGVVSWEDGDLTGDEAIVGAAKAVKQISPVAMAPMVDVDWDNPNHVAEALRIGAEHVYGSPVKVDIATRSKPKVETSMSTSDLVF